MAFRLPSWRMSPNSLFAILLRSPWWVSLLVAGGLFAVSRLFIPWYYAIFMPLPFVVIAGIAAARQLRTPSASRIEAAVQAARAMSWEAFSQALVAGYRRQGFTVTVLEGEAADLLIERAGRTGVVCARRWKAARSGVEPLQALQAVRERRDVHDAVYLVTGEVTAQAQAHAARHLIRLAGGPELLALMR